MPGGAAELRKLLKPEQIALFDWMLAACNRNPAHGTILLGYLSAEAVAHPDWNFWQLLEAARPRVKFGIIQ